MASTCCTPRGDLKTRSVYEKASTQNNKPHTPPRTREGSRGADATRGRVKVPPPGSTPTRPAHVQPQGMGPDPSETACGSCAPSSCNPPEARERRKPPRAPAGGRTGCSGLEVVEFGITEGCDTLPNDAWECGFRGAPQTRPNAGITEVISLPNDTWERGSKEHCEPDRQV